MKKIVFYDDSENMIRFYEAAAASRGIPNDELALEMHPRRKKLADYTAVRGIITDGDLGNATGVDVAQDARAAGFKGVIYLVSHTPAAYADMDTTDGQRATTIIDGFFEKPCGRVIDTLADIISKLLTHKRNP